jgi:hypothetical protein
MPKKMPVVRSLDKKWDEQGKTLPEKRRLRYYYRHRIEILAQFKSYKNSYEVCL